MEGKPAGSLETPYMKKSTSRSIIVFGELRARDAAARVRPWGWHAIKLRLTRNLSSADATTGERVDFEVPEEVRVKDVLIVPRGGIAWASVTEAPISRSRALLECKQFRHDRMPNYARQEW
jgi:hypothetical protein